MATGALEGVSVLVLVLGAAVSGYGSAINHRGNFASDELHILN
jgi:hypothetical protein